MSNWIITTNHQPQPLQPLQPQQPLQLLQPQHQLLLAFLNGLVIIIVMIQIII